MKAGQLTWMKIVTEIKIALNKIIQCSLLEFNSSIIFSVSLNPKSQTEIFMQTSKTIKKASILMKSFAYLSRFFANEHSLFLHYFSTDKYSIHQ